VAPVCWVEAIEVRVVVRVDGLSKHILESLGNIQ
jgi:hypothetical protein